MYICIYIYIYIYVYMQNADVYTPDRDLCRGDARVHCAGTSCTVCGSSRDVRGCMDDG